MLYNADPIVAARNTLLPFAELTDRPDLRTTWGGQVTNLEATRLRPEFALLALPVRMALFLGIVSAIPSCASNLAINRGPLTGPFVLAEPNGQFHLHATVTNGGTGSSAAAVLEVCPSISVSDDTGDCPPLFAGLDGGRHCQVQGLDPNQSQSFNFPIDQSWCDQKHCCTGWVALRLTDASGNPLTGQSTELEVQFDQTGDLKGMKVVLPGDAGYSPLTCGDWAVLSDCTK